jgi:hypothetical protein
MNKKITPDEYARKTYFEDMELLGRQRGKNRMKYSIKCPLGQYRDDDNGVQDTSNGRKSGRDRKEG